VDEVDCYVFDVTPRVLEKKHRYFNGRIWVATAGLQIVVTQGRMVSAVARKRISIRLSLHGANRLTATTGSRLRARRRHVALHRWPRLHASNVHIRDTIKYTGYKRFSATAKIFDEGQDTTPQERSRRSRERKAA